GLTIGWSRDDRDNLLVPTRGRYQRAFAEIGLPVLDLQYYRLNYQYQQFFQIFPRVTLAFNGELGYGDGYSGDAFPFFKNYYVGGIGSVRGFETGSLGPRDIDDSALGGNRRLNLSVEAYVPIPGADRTLRALTFVDAGQVWGLAPRRDAAGNPILVPFTDRFGQTLLRPVYDEERIDLGNLRYSIGIGIAWVSPLGPLKLSYAYPLNREQGDRVQRFQFQIGTGF
ncbi:MAG: BamA/TamA family outer membrane protein, partial [Burkholderiaceae bacterium]